jgi:hypothetical protein
MLRFRGRDRGLTASNESLTKFWRVAYSGGDRHQGHTFQLSGAPVAADDFPPGGVLRVWEFGVGDEFAVRTGVSLRRVGSIYEVMATTPFRLSMPGSAVSISSDRKAWQPVAVQKSEGRVRAALTEDMLGAGTLFLRVDR